MGGLGALSSLTGGGALTASSSAKSGDAFSGQSNYTFSAPQRGNWQAGAMIAAGLVLAAVLLRGK